MAVQSRGESLGGDPSYADPELWLQYDQSPNAAKGKPVVALFVSCLSQPFVSGLG